MMDIPQIRFMRCIANGGKYLRVGQLELWQGDEDIPDGWEDVTEEYLPIIKSLIERRSKGKN